MVAKEGDTVEPGTKIAVISKSGEGFEPVDHVAPSEKPSEEAAPPPPPAGEKKEKSQSKVESPAANIKKEEKPKPTPEASPLLSETSATEPRLPPKRGETRVRLYSGLIITFLNPFNNFNICLRDGMSILL